MKKILGWLCIVSILLMSTVAGTTISFASEISTATVTDVYATGNWTVGGTVTAHYTYYDPAGKNQVGDAAVQWYRTKVNAYDGTPIAGATSANYIITADDTSYMLYFTVTVSNADGTGKTFYSPEYTSPKAVNTAATAPVALRTHIALTGGATEYVPGATVRAVMQVAYQNLAEAGSATYSWSVRDTMASTEKTVRANTETYTITEEDYGKWLECATRSYDVNKKSTYEQKVVVKVGTRFALDSEPVEWKDIYHKLTASGSNVPANTINNLWYQSNDSLYSGGNWKTSIIVDTKKSVKFDGFYFNASNVKTDFKLQYSTDNEVWNDLPVTVETAGQVEFEKNFDSVYTARYFKISYGTAGACYLYNAFPYLSDKNRGAEYVDIASAGYGIVVDNKELTLSNITIGMPLKALKESFVLAKDTSVVSVIDASGIEVSDITDIILTTENISDYCIRVSNGNNSQIYTMDLANAIYTNNFSGMIEGKEYNDLSNVVSGATCQHIPGTASYWYNNASNITAEKTTYGIRETLDDGSYAVKIVSNGVVAKNYQPLKLNVDLNNLDSNGFYSFKFRIKTGENTEFKVAAKANGSWISRDSLRMDKEDGIKIPTSAANTLEYKEDYDINQWYDVEIVTDLKNKTQSVWIDGNNYCTAVPFTVGQNTITKLTYEISLFDTVGKSNDISYIADINGNKVWDINSKVSADAVEPAELVSAGYGVEVDNKKLQLDNIIIGMPLKTLKESLVPAKDTFVISVIDALGNDVSDITAITLTAENISDYRIRVSGDNNSQDYTMVFANAVYTNNFSGMIEGKEYNDLSNVVEDATCQHIPGTASYWYNDAANITAEKTAYGIRETLDDGSYAVKIVSNGVVAKTRQPLKLNVDLNNLDSNGFYSFKFRIKTGENTEFKVAAKANGSWISRDSLRMYKKDGLMLPTSADKTFVHKAGFKLNQWYDVEIVTDLKNKTESVWIDGVNYCEAIPFTVGQNTITKLTYEISLFDTVGKSNDISYIADIKGNKVWDINSKVSAEGTGTSMKLYDGDTVVEALTPGATYTAKRNGNVFCDDYIVAVYQVEYADTAVKTEIGSKLINVYSAKGNSAEQISNIVIPATAYSNYDSGNTKTAAAVKIFSWNDGVVPTGDFIKID